MATGRSQKGAVLNKELDFARLTIHMQQIEEKEKKISEAREKDRAPDTQSQDSVAQQHHTHPRCDTCGKNHSGRYYFEGRNCYTCGKVGHFQKYCPSTGGNAWGTKPQATFTAPPHKGAPSAAGNNHNRLYALTNCQEAEVPPDVVTGTL
ncbi:uncharacterized protein LOC124887914 [Capsicum annuum]|uniref:uncharacterized protein LOC124887914 n=1 Tax=Capsicum annuum TaxID=4072 RepID=UPI001FB18D96|nr:uncharacterized protein LOC124887914 [Capsicum annuum]